MTDQWNLIVDVALCENCHNCTLASKDEHVGNAFPGYAAALPAREADLIRIKSQRRGQAPMVDATYMPTMCNHCDDAPCMRIGGDAVRKRADGIVIIDPEKAKGRRDIVDACPYGAVIWNEAAQLPQIWIFDAHLLDQGWTMPRCQQACPTGVYEAVKVSDTQMAEIAATRNLQVLKPELGTKPRVYYRNLQRYDLCFIGGSVSVFLNGVAECAHGAQAALYRSNELLASTQTDLFGEFKFDGLKSASGDYTVKITHPTWGSAHAQATLGESCYLGEILLVATNSTESK